ncbi:hypothetical protein HF520_04445 [Romboutsia sp. CE17]|uniref:ornithine cyclodeaminase family domain n=1 Tax=Romboutsia sp. CE17 TaxID=2724150 RepID=UPI001442DF60|nr:hypothetical protein [Romboutsia sp. CE17]QJA08239.1 hypothetical protein HF520_04445 [Romboutsia sp. CE17]
MSFQLPKYNHPNFNEERFLIAPNAEYKLVEKDGVAPDNYHAMSIFPEYFKINGKWILAEETRMDCVPRLNSNNEIEIVEFRALKVNDKVIVGRTEDASEGIYLHANGFVKEEQDKDVFAFRGGRSRETSQTMDYDKLIELLKYEKENGYVVWVMGPAAVFSEGARNSLTKLINSGYVHAFLGGNAVATHDLEAGIFHTALGQDIYTQESIKNGHYCHLDLLNKARKYDSIEKLIEEENITSGLMQSCYKNNIPVVLGGSIRDDGPLPIVISDVYKAQDEMRKHIRKATTVICMATQLHTIATGNMTPSFRVVDKNIRPIYFYTIDTSEFAVNKLRDRGSLEVITMISNAQDFLQRLADNLE